MLLQLLGLGIGGDFLTATNRVVVGAIVGLEFDMLLLFARAVGGLSGGFQDLLLMVRALVLLLHLDLLLATGHIRCVQRSLRNRL